MSGGPSSARTFTSGRPGLTTPLLGGALLWARVVWHTVCRVCKSYAKPYNTPPGRGGRHRLAISGGVSIFGWCSAWRLQRVQVSCQKSFFGSEKCQKKSNSLLTRKKVFSVSTVA